MEVTVQVNKKLAIRARRVLPEGYDKKTHVKCKTELSERVLKGLSEAELEALVEYHVNTVREIEKARFPELASNDTEEFVQALKAWTLDVERAKASAADFLSRAERWVAKHGSERLKLIVKEGFLHSSLSLYRSERIEHLASAWEWVSDKKGQQDKRTLNPPMEGFELLETARKDLPEARLVSWRIDTPGKARSFERRWACRATFLGSEVILLGKAQ